jgi:hypothetical protein
MKTINTKSHEDRKFLRQIGGRVVETCFTCIYELHSRCTMRDFEFVASSTSMIFVCNRHTPIADVCLEEITHGIAGNSQGVPRVKTPNLDTQPKRKARKITPGCYINTRMFGEAVCIENKGKWITIRYEAARCSDLKTIWVWNSTLAEDCTYLERADPASRAVLKMRGPYGED